MRYSAYGDLDDKPLIDGDQGFIGLNTFIDPSKLPTGTLSLAENVRLDTGNAVGRNGIENLLTVADNTVITNAVFLDVIPLNAPNSSSDNLLIGCEGNGFLWNQDTNNVTTINDPVDFPIITKSFLLDCKVDQLLFSDPGPTLPFVLNATSGITLGNSVLRLNNDQNEFLHYKQKTITSITHPDPAYHRVEVVGHEFNVDELVAISASLDGHDRIYRVVTKDRDTIDLIEYDNRPRVIVGTPNANAYVYSIEDQCPPAEFATFSGNRLIVPTGQDQLKISSPLSTTVFPITNTLVVSAKETGDITAIEPMADDSLVIFKSNSIYLLTGIYDMKGVAEGGRLNISRVTDQLGTLSRQSVRAVGEEIFFHSPQGIYAITLNARGAGGIGLPPQAIRISDSPLSKPIENLLDGASNTDSSSAYHKGRFYITTGNQILIYNANLKNWESRDYFYEPSALATKVQTSGWFKCFVLNTNNGSILVYSNRSKGIFNASNSNLFADTHGPNVADKGQIETQIITREYQCQSYDLKHFRRGTVCFDIESQSWLEAQALTAVPSETVDLLNFRDANLNKVAQVGRHQTRSQLRTRAEGLRIRVYNDGDGAGRIKVKSTLVEASPGSRQTVDRT